MSNALFFSLAAVGAAVLIALALVTPQGLGARSAAPFGHPVAPLRAAGPLPAMTAPAPLPLRAGR